MLWITVEPSVCDLHEDVLFEMLELANKLGINVRASLNGCINVFAVPEESLSNVKTRYKMEKDLYFKELEAGRRKKPKKPGDIQLAEAP